LVNSLKTNDQRLLSGKIDVFTSVRVMKSEHTPHRIGFVSLGCPKATVDSEHILTQLRAEGYVISPSYDEAELVVINTCGFIDDAIEESLEAIGEALHENGKVIVTGCLGAKGDIVRQTYPNVLAVTGPHATQEVMEAIHQHLPPAHDPFLDLVPAQGIRLTPRHYAYLKISEGCNHRCTFCIIPDLRGDLVSRPVNEVLNEAERLVAAGVREILVISQDTSAYGIDVKYKTEFWNGMPVKTRMKEMCEALAGLGIWIRLHYVYPYPHVDEIIPLMADGKLLPYLDIPFQHASPRILKAMKRPAASENTLQRIRAWREICPELTLRSTFIVGFPGETEDDFEQLLDFLDQAQLDRVGCFTYSPVEGAKANQLPDHVDEDTKQERLQRFMERQAAISTQRLQQKIGTEQLVLVDAVSDAGAIARSTADAPEIDGLVYIEEQAELVPGEFIKVHIDNTDEHDMWGSIIR
jgi:ribosomal protein S12 methylthiotransferase